MKMTSSPHLIFPIFKMGLMTLVTVPLLLWRVDEVLLKRHEGLKHSCGSKGRTLMECAYEVHSDTSEEKPFQTAGPRVEAGVWSKA